jgi:hypothetical protein
MRGRGAIKRKSGDLAIGVGYSYTVLKRALVGPLVQGLMIANT